MSKTRKMRSKTTKYHDRACCEATMHGLHEWYENKIEKLGYMVLAKARGHDDKIICYKISLNRLQQAIEHKLTHIQEKDRKDDLQIMLHNVNILIEHVNKDFGV